MACTALIGYMPMVSVPLLKVNRSWPATVNVLALKSVVCLVQVAFVGVRVMRCSAVSRSIGNEPALRLTQQHVADAESRVKEILRRALRDAGTMHEGRLRQERQAFHWQQISQRNVQRARRRAACKVRSSWKVLPAVGRKQASLIADSCSACHPTCPFANAH